MVSSVTAWAQRFIDYSSTFFNSDSAPPLNDPKKTYIDKEQRLNSVVKIPDENRQAVKEFLRRVPYHDIDKCCEVLQRLPRLGKDEQALVVNLKWNAPIFKNKESISYYALREFLIGNLCVDRLSEILLFAECTYFTPEAENTKTHRLFDDSGHRDQNAIHQLRKGLDLYFSDEHLEIFLSDLEKSLPPERTQFYSMPVYSWAEGMSEVFLNYDHNLLQYKNDFYPDHQSGRICFIQIALSPLLFYKLCQSKFRMQAMKPNPILGPSQKIENFQHPNLRDVFLPSCITSSPTKLHNAKTTPYAVYRHDLYHLYIESCNPHRKAWIELGKIFDVKKDDEKQICETLHDREFRRYDPVYFEFQILQTKYRQYPPTVEDLFWIVLFGQDLKPNQTQKILMHIYKFKKKWRIEFNIDLGGFINFCPVKMNPYDPFNGSNHDLFKNRVEIGKKILIDIEESSRLYAQA